MVGRLAVAMAPGAFVPVTAVRADSAAPSTLDRRALYTYAHEKPGQVLCNDVDNWFAVKIHS